MLWTENMKPAFQYHFASYILMSSPCCANRSCFCHGELSQRCPFHPAPFLVYRESMVWRSLSHCQIEIICFLTTQQDYQTGKGHENGTFVQDQFSQKSSSKQKKAQLTNFFRYTFNGIPGQIQNNKAVKSSNKLRNFLQASSVKLPFLEMDQFQ